MLDGYWRHRTTIRIKDVGRSSGYRRYCHCDGRGKKDDVKVMDQETRWQNCGSGFMII